MSPSRYFLFLIFLSLVLPFQISKSSPGGNSGTYPPKSIMFIMDASGSMNDRMNGQTRMKLAVQKLEAFLKTLPADTEMGLVAYGNRIPGCDSARLYSPLKRGSKGEILAKLPLLFPAGSTPIARTLDLVNKHLLAGNPNTEIILISDGIESCDGDPLMEIGKIRRRNPNVKLHVLGLDVQPSEDRDLQALAIAGEGKYFSVKSGPGMENALSSIWTGRPVRLQQELSQASPDRGNKLPLLADIDPPPGPKSLPGPPERASDKKILPPVEVPFIRITEMETKEINGKETEYLVWYEFEGYPEGRQHTVQILMLPEKSISAVEIPVRRFEKAPSVIQTVTIDHRNRKGYGYIRFRTDTGAPLSLAAELWEVQGIPKIIAKSQERSLQEAKKTESFPEIYR
jgi:Ca-activated chloride channel family protein